jgi:hypothetical protein
MPCPSRIQSVELVLALLLGLGIAAFAAGEFLFSPPEEEPAACPP